LGLDPNPNNSLSVDGIRDGVDGPMLDEILDSLSDQALLW